MRLRALEEHHINHTTFDQEYLHGSLQIIFFLKIY